MALKGSLEAQWLKVNHSQNYHKFHHKFMSLKYSSPLTSTKGYFCDEQLLVSCNSHWIDCGHFSKSFNAWYLFHLLKICYILDVKKKILFHYKVQVAKQSTLYIYIYQKHLGQYQQRSFEWPMATLESHTLLCPII